MDVLVRCDRAGRRCARCHEVRFAKAVPLFTWRSEKREYVFDRVVKKRLVLDPSQPIVGGVFAANAGARVVRSHRDHLATWRALGVVAPLVWSFGATTEAQSGYLRAQVASVGWTLSTVPWLQGPATVGDFGDDALPALVRALDDALPDPAG